MSGNDDPLTHYIPRRLDDPAKFLFWEYDVAAIAGFGVFVGIYGGMLVPGLVLGLGGAAGWSKVKSGKHRGIAVHVMYWFTGYPKMKELPPSHLKELIG